MTYALTPTQQRLLDVIRTHIAATGVAPTFDEMLAATGLRSKNTIHRLLNRLEERGAIRRWPNRARAIEVVDPDDALAAENARLRTALHSICVGDGWAASIALTTRRLIRSGKIVSRRISSTSAICP